MNFYEKILRKILYWSLHTYNRCPRSTGFGSLWKRLTLSRPGGQKICSIRRRTDIHPFKTGLSRAIITKSLTIFKLFELLTTTQPPHPKSDVPYPTKPRIDPEDRPYSRQMPAAHMFGSVFRFWVGAKFGTSGRRLVLQI